MIGKKSFCLMGILTVLLSPAAIALSGWDSPLRAQSRPPWKVSVIFPPTQPRGAPGRTNGTGARGPACGNEGIQLPLTALMPKNNVGTTVTRNPSVYLYVPETADKKAEFLVFDLTNRKQIYETILPVPNRAGILKLNLPETLELKLGNKYMWHVGIICDPNDHAQNQVVQGLLERTFLSPELEAKIRAEKQPLQQAKLYAAAGIWNETVTLLARLRDSYPAEWAELLNSVELGEIAQSPILDCCQPENQARYTIEQ